MAVAAGLLRARRLFALVGTPLLWDSPCSLAGLCDLVCSAALSVYLLVGVVLPLQRNMFVAFQQCMRRSMIGRGGSLMSHEVAIAVLQHELGAAVHADRWQSINC